MGEGAPWRGACSCASARVLAPADSRAAGRRPHRLGRHDMELEQLLQEGGALQQRACAGPGGCSRGAVGSAACRPRLQPPRAAVRQLPRRSTRRTHYLSLFLSRASARAAYSASAAQPLGLGHTHSSPPRPKHLSALTPSPPQARRRACPLPAPSASARSPCLASAASKAASEGTSSVAVKPGCCSSSFSEGCAASTACRRRWQVEQGRLQLG